MGCPARRNGRKSLVLCVEDDPNLRADIVEELCASGHETIEAADGREALDRLGSVRPELVLCDITMPGMDGHELLSVMRAPESDLADIPVIFLTARDTREDVLEGKRSGAEDYLIKPVDFELMLASIDARLAQSRRLSGDVLPGDVLPGAGPDAGPGRVDAPDGRIGLGLLDRLSVGVILVGNDGRIVFANDRARALSAHTRAFFLHDRLRMATTNLTAQFRDCIAMVVEAAARREDLMRGMTVPRMDGDGAEVSLICLPAETGTPRPRIAVFLSDPAHPVACPPETLSCLFGLTPTEAQVTQALVGGRQRAEVARDLGISQTTVAFHLRNIFEKTGTNRQIDLVGRVMRAFAAIG